MRPSPGLTREVPRLRLNVTVYFSPEAAFNPCEPLWRGMESESLQILVVMDAAKSVAHLRRRNAESLGILSREQQRSFSGYIS
jgi:hypothetical protein